MYQLLRVNETTKCRVEGVGIRVYSFIKYETIWLRLSETTKCLVEGAGIRASLSIFQDDTYLRLIIYVELVATRPGDISLRGWG